MAHIAGAARIDVNRRVGDADGAGPVHGDVVSLRRLQTARSGDRRRGRRARQPARARSPAEDLLHQHRRRVLGRRTIGRADPHDARRREGSRAAGQRARLLPDRIAARTGALPVRASPTASRRTIRTTTGWRCAALLVAMDKWVRDRVAPPPSRYPRLQDGTLVRAADVAFPNVPTVTSPRSLSAGVRGANRLAAAGWRRRGAAAAARAAGRSGRQRARRHPAARGGRAARDLYRLELPQAGDRRARSAVSAAGIVRGVFRHQERSANRRTTRGRRSTSAIRRANGIWRWCRRPARRW